MITIRKAVLSGSAPARIRDETAGLASAPLRDLALRLAADPALTVSVISYEDGRQELEVLHTGPPGRAGQAIDRLRFPRNTADSPARTVSVAGPAGLQDAVALVRAMLREAAVP